MSMQQISQAIGAGGSWRLQTGGDYFRILSSPDPVDVVFYGISGAEVARATQMDEGFYLRPAGGFAGVLITSATAQTVKIMILQGDGGYDHFNVDITSALQAIAVNISGAAAMDINPGQFVGIQQGDTITDNAAVNVGVAATALAAASATRKSLRFTNAGTVDVYLGGAGVTTANGAIKIAAGQTWVEDDGAAAAWYGISGTAGQSVRVQEIGA